MYDPCKHRVPIDQAPLLLGVRAGSRNKGRRKEGRKLPSTAPSKYHWQHLWGLSGAASSSLPIPAICPQFSPRSSLLHLPFCHTSLAPAPQKWPKSPCFALMVTSWGLFSRTKELTRPCVVEGLVRCCPPPSPVRHGGAHVVCPKPASFASQALCEPQ